MNPFIIYKHILSIYLNQQQIEELEKRWNEPHRKWHGLTHLINFLNAIEKLILTSDDKIIMIIAAFYHDVVYEIGSSTNEEDSIKLLKKHISDEEFIELVSELINATENNQEPSNYFEKIFWRIDNNVLLNGTLSELIEYEKMIAQEYLTVYDKDVYKEGRIKFLESRLYQNRDNIKKLIDWIHEEY